MNGTLFARFYKETLFLLAITACSALSSNLTLSAAATEDARSEKAGFYQPREYAEYDYDDPNARFCWARSRESEHFYLFWEPGFGDDTNAKSLPEKMRVDSDDFMKKAETFYRSNVEKLGFIDELPYGYKIQVYLMYTEDWLATGAGFDDKIGALWISPSTCKPVGDTIAHEVGHSFQYLVFCKQLERGEKEFGKSGFRYAYPGGVGNAFWEICAQWQAWQTYPQGMVTWFDMDVWFANYRRAFENELCRYQNYWLLYYLTQKHGIDLLARIWNESRYPDDALTTYMRLYLNDDLDLFYDNMYEYASKIVTFDLDACRPYAQDQQGRYDSVLYDAQDGWRRIAYASCPEVNGFSAIKLEPAAGKTVRVEFKALEPGSPLAADDPGEYLVNESEKKVTRTYNRFDEGTVGRRYGFVALQEDGTRVYSPARDDSEATVEFEIPEKTKLLYFVVLGTADRYVPHVWDATELNDAQAPFAVRVSYCD